MKNKFFPALAVLIGTTIGAGFLGIPYVVSKSGFMPGLAYLIFVAIFMFFVKLYLGEVILRTQGNHQLTGYAHKYLGRTGKTLMFFAMVFGIYSALVAYLMGEGQSLSYVIFGNFHFSFYFSLLFWLAMTFLTYIGLKALKKYSQISAIVMFTFIFLILIVFSSGIRTENLSYVNKEFMFVPFGVILFSFLAFSAMPEVRRILLTKEKLFKKTIMLGMLIPLLIYIIFTFVVVGNFTNVSDIATFSLGRFFSLLAVITMFTAFFCLSLAIRDMFRFDFGWGRFRGWLLASFLPLILFLLISIFKLASFIEILALGGVVSGGLTGILVLLMNIKAKKLGNRNPEYSLPINWFVVFIFSLLFIAAVVLEFLY